MPAPVNIRNPYIKPITAATSPTNTAIRYVLPATNTKVNKIKTSNVAINLNPTLIFIGLF